MCPKHGYDSPCVCIECEYCKDQFVQPVETAYLESTYYADCNESVTSRTAQDYVVICRRLNVRADAYTKNARIDVLTRGTTVQVLSIENGWAKIVRADGSEAYVFAKYIREV